MKAIISVQAETNEVTITLQELDWEAVERQSFYEGEGTVQRAGMGPSEDDPVAVSGKFTLRGIKC